MDSTNRSRSHALPQFTHAHTRTGTIDRLIARSTDGAQQAARRGRNRSTSTRRRLGRLHFETHARTRTQDDVGPPRQHQPAGGRAAPTRLLVPAPADAATDPDAPGRAGLRGPPAAPGPDGPLTREHARARGRRQLHVLPRARPAGGTWIDGGWLVWTGASGGRSIGGWVWSIGACMPPDCRMMLTPGTLKISTPTTPNDPAGPPARQDAPPGGPIQCRVLFLGQVDRRDPLPRCVHVGMRSGAFGLRWGIDVKRPGSGQIGRSISHINTHQPIYYPFV